MRQTNAENPSAKFCGICGKYNELTILFMATDHFKAEEMLDSIPSAKRFTVI